MTEEPVHTPSAFKGIKKKVRAFVVLAILLIALPELVYIAFRSNTVQTIAIRWVMDQVGQTFNTKIKVGGIDISFFDQITLEKILVEDQSRDTLVYIDQLKLQIDSIRLGSRRIHLNSIIVQQPRIHLRQDTTGTNFQFVLDSLNASPPQKSNSPWELTFRNLFVRDAEIRFKKPYADTILHKGINFDDLEIRNLNFALVNVHKEKSATEMSLDHASFIEKSGYSVNNLTFKALTDTSGIFLSKFALITPHSNIFSDSMKVRPRTSQLLDKLSSVKNMEDLP